LADLARGFARRPLRVISDFIEPHARSKTAVPLMGSQVPAGFPPNCHLRGARRRRFHDRGRDIPREHRRHRPLGDEAHPAAVLTRDEARRTAANFAKLPDLLKRGDCSQSITGLPIREVR
jgi:hypothetical protein